MKRLQSLDWDKWSNNTLVFSAPLIIMYLLFVQSNINLDGIQVNDFAPDEKLTGAGILYIINVLLDFFKKYRSA